MTARLAAYQRLRAQPISHRRTKREILASGRSGMITAASFFCMVLVVPPYNLDRIEMINIRDRLAAVLGIDCQ